MANRGRWLLALVAVITACTSAVGSPTAPSAASPAIGSGPAAPPSAALPSPPPSPSASSRPIGSLPANCPAGPDPVPVAAHVGDGFGSELVWAIGFGAAGRLLVDRDAPRSDRGWLQKVLWLVRDTVDGAITISGVSSEGLSLWFDYQQTGETSWLVLDPASPDGSEVAGWLEYRGYFVVPEAGCYRLSVSWSGGGWELPIAVGLREDGS